MLGASIGSFITMAAYRIPKGKSMVFPSSYCPKCGKKLKKYSLVPILSFLFQRGRCLECGEKISRRYLLIEVANTAMYVVLFCMYGATLKTIYLGIVFSTLFLISYIDFECMLVDLRTILFLLFLSIIHIICNPIDPLSVIYTVLIYYVFLLVCERITKMVTGKMKDFVGGGDKKLVAVCGCFLARGQIGAFFLLSGLFGILTAIVWKRLKRESMFPFGPALALSLFILLNQYYLM
ncbi:MAG: prepilin peptidase [Rickettsiales bacterium]|jgi:prepilin signal peptidase PulO-like enzyme (type II secretory pathway)|nr:prepilin peptidase [Rickettsiales bacterium]